MGNKHPSATNKQGCAVFALIFSVVLMVVAWLAMQSTDSQRMNEVLPAAQAKT
jgi:hypothetical protein